jgi:hypothetical protein
MSYGVVPPKSSILDGSAYKDDAADDDSETQSLLAKVCALRSPSLALEISACEPLCTMNHHAAGCGDVVKVLAALYAVHRAIPRVPQPLQL